jgi:hypothetical protein
MKGEAMATEFLEQDETALKAGALYYYDEVIQSRNAFNGYRQHWHFARYYFNAQHGEVGYFLPDMLQFHERGRVNLHPTPRQWHIVPHLQPIKGGFYDFSYRPKSATQA